MSVLKCCILLVAIVHWAGGAPPEIRKMQLERVLEKAVCPSKVFIDEDPDRIPRLIKTIECDTDASAMCSADQTSPMCCHHKQLTFRTSCVQVMDKVMVRYKGIDEPRALPVPVGCTCTVQQSRATQDAS